MMSARTAIALLAVSLTGLEAKADGAMALAETIGQGVATATAFSRVPSTEQASVCPGSNLVRKGRWVEIRPSGTVLMTNAVEGEVWSDAFEDALRRGGILRIPPRRKPYYIDRPLVLSDGQVIIATGAEVRMRPGGGSCLLHNAGVVGMEDQMSLRIPETPYACNILVEGGTWTALRTARDIFNGNGDASCPKGRPVHGCHGAFVFNHAKGVVVRGVTVGGCLTHALQFSDVHGFLVKDVAIQLPTRDGVHLHGGCDWGVISGVGGASGDDFVALNAWDWCHTAPVVGPLHHVLVERVVCGDDGSCSIRLLPGNRRRQDGSGETVDCGIRDVVMRDIRGVRNIKAYDQPNLEIGRDKDRSEPIGKLERIYIRNLALTRPCSIEIDNHVDGFEISGVRYEYEPKPFERLVTIGPMTGKWGRTEIFSPDEDIVVKDFSLSDVVVVGSGRRLFASDCQRVSHAGKGKVLFR